MAVLVEVAKIVRVQVVPGKPGGKFWKEKRYKPKKYLPIECAHGNQPVRFPNWCVFVRTSLRPFSLAVAFLRWCGGGGDVKQLRDVVWGVGNVEMRCSDKRLWSGTCQKTCYNRIAKYCTVLQSTNLQCRVLQSISPYDAVLLRTTKFFSKYYQNTTQRYKVHNETYIKLAMPHTSKSSWGNVYIQLVAFYAHQTSTQVPRLMKNQWCWWVCSQKQLQWNGYPQTGIWHIENGTPFFELACWKTMIIAW